MLSPVNCEGTSIYGFAVTPHAVRIDLCLLETQQLGCRLDLQKSNQKPDTHDADLKCLFRVKDGREQLNDIAVLNTAVQDHCRYLQHNWTVI